MTKLQYLEDDDTVLVAVDDDTLIEEVVARVEGMEQSIQGEYDNSLCKNAISHLKQRIQSLRNAAR